MSWWALLTLSTLFTLHTEPRIGGVSGDERMDPNIFFRERQKQVDPPKKLPPVFVGDLCPFKQVYELLLYVYLYIIDMFCISLRWKGACLTKRPNDLTVSTINWLAGLNCHPKIITCKQWPKPRYLYNANMSSAWKTTLAWAVFKSLVGCLIYSRGLHYPVVLGLW